jgi:HSP20 family protein
MSQFTLNNFEERLNQLGDDLYNFVGKVMPESQKNAGFALKMDVFIQDDTLTLMADLPGMSREDLKISLQNRVINISGERKNDLPDSVELIKSERIFGRFTRSFTIPEGVNSSDIKASFKKGVLYVTMPVTETRDTGIDIEIE